MRQYGSAVQAGRHRSGRPQAGSHGFKRSQEPAGLPRLLCGPQLENGMSASKKDLPAFLSEQSAVRSASRALRSSSGVILSISPASSMLGTLLLHVLDLKLR